MIEVYYVEDDEIIAKSVKQYLEQHNGKVSLFRTIADAKKAFTLSRPEYQILLLLMENKGKTVTRRQLLEQVWDSSGNYVNDNTLTVTMKRLREKLQHPLCLKTIRSFGYRMEDTK